MTRLIDATRRMGWIAALALFTLAATCVCSHAESLTPALRVCMIDVPHVPWRMPDSDGRVRDKGMDLVLLRLFSARSGWDFSLVRASGRRCLRELGEGNVDAMVGLSYLPEREEIAVYPKRDGKPDVNRALRYDSYSWYVLKTSPQTWDGERLVPEPRQRVAAQAGHSVVAVLRDRGFVVDDRARGAELNLMKVARGDVGAAALLTTEADWRMRDEPELRDKLKRIDPPIDERAYYVVFSRQFARTQTGGVEPLWEHFVDAVHSADYEEVLRNALRPTR